MTETLPLFPLNTVLFPEGLLPLRVFEARYMDMIGGCMKENRPFGVCLIASGSEVGAAAQPHPVGVSARVIAWDMSQPGVLSIIVRGEKRYRIHSQHSGANNLLLGEVEWLPPLPALPVPEAQRNLIPLLQILAADARNTHFPTPHHFDDAAWVGARYAEILPIQNLARQKLLELDDVVSRLEIIQQYLDQRGLLGKPGEGSPHQS